MIEAAVELVEHPRRRFGPLQQSLRMFDEIVEIENARTLFRVAIGFVQLQCEGQGCDCVLCALDSV